MMTLPLSRIERVMGPSRVGKSMLINALRRAFPETKVDGRRRVPVVVVPVPTPVSPVLLPSSVLTALGLPVQRSITSGAMGNRMLDQLKLAGSRDPHHWVGTRNIAIWCE